MSDLDKAIEFLADLIMCDMIDTVLEKDVDFPE